MAWRPAVEWQHKGNASICVHSSLLSEAQHVKHFSWKVAINWSHAAACCRTRSPDSRRPGSCSTYFCWRVLTHDDLVWRLKHCICGPEFRVGNLHLVRKEKGGENWETQLGSVRVSVCVASAPLTCLNALASPSLIYRLVHTWSIALFVSSPDLSTYTTLLVFFGNEKEKREGKTRKLKTLNPNIQNVISDFRLHWLAGALDMPEDWAARERRKEGRALTRTQTQRWNAETVGEKKIRFGCESKQVAHWILLKWSKLNFTTIFFIFILYPI